jgi:Ni,Fe-hydrogenase I large subunit
MSEIIIDPFTRISGFLEIKVETDQNRITNAESKGLLFRGFEKMLVGRSPLDAVFFTERICGICSAAHAYASTLALDNALKKSPTLNDRYLRDIIHGFEFIQNHLRHFYLFVVPSFVKITKPMVANVTQYQDYRLPAEVNNRIEEHYEAGIEFSRLAHEGQAVIGGKAPHHHGIFVGGVTCSLSAYTIEKLKVIIEQLLSFVTTTMREDTEVIANYYPDYYQMGFSYPHFMSYGVFDYEDPAISYVYPGILANGVRYAFDPNQIHEQVQYSWYQNDNPEEVNINKPDAYTFIKAPRYNNMPMEVGPLARMLLSGNYSGGNSCMDRIMARTLEAVKIITIMRELINRVQLLPNNQKPIELPDEAGGAGLIDTTRGALGHWISIKNKKIEHYELITPSNWNLSPKDANGVYGVIERSLLDTYINNVQSPVEIGRIVRSFDPCVSCATHVITPDKDIKTIEVPV